MICSDKFRHDAGSLIAGLLFALGWLIFFDGVLFPYFGASTTCLGQATMRWYAYFPGLVSTASLVLLNLVQLRDLSPFGLFWDPEVGMRVRLWLFGTFILSFVPLMASVWIAVADAVWSSRGDAHCGFWASSSVVLQTFLIFFASLVFLFARKHNSSEEQVTF